MSQVMTRPYSPLPPNTPGPGSPCTPQPEQAKGGVAPLDGGIGRPSGSSKATSKGRDPLPIHQGKAGDTNTMAPRNSGKGKGPEGKKDWKRKGGGGRGQARGRGDPRTGGSGREPGCPGGGRGDKKGGRDERVQTRSPNPPPRPHRWDSTGMREGRIGSSREVAKGWDTNIQPTDPTPTPPTVATTHPLPSVPATPNPQEVHTTPTTPGVATIPVIPAGAAMPTVPTVADIHAAPGVATRPTHPARATPLLMNKEDNSAPQKLFATLKPLTERVLAPAEWTCWCHDLQRWTAGLSKWAYDRSKADSPQQTWGRRQAQRRNRGDNPPGGRENQDGQGPPPHTGRNRTITRMANLQRQYNSSPKECMDSIRHTPPSLRCEVPKEEVERYFGEKLKPPEGINADASPPFRL